MSRLVSIVVFLLALFSSAIAAQPATAPPPFKIKLDVTFPEATADVFQSNLARELRKLDSVDVVNDEIADNKLSVVGVATSSGGFAAAVLLSLKARAGLEFSLFFSDNAECWPTEAQQKESIETYKDYVVISHLWVFTGGDVQSLAARIAAAIDVNDVEAHRQFYRRMDERRSKRQQQEKQ